MAGLQSPNHPRHSMNRAVANPNARRPQAPMGPAPPVRLMKLDTSVPGANRFGTLICLVGLALTAIFLRGDTPEDLARFGAVGVLISLAASVAMDLRRGFFNIVRADWMALIALYFLTLTEFLV